MSTSRARAGLVVAAIAVGCALAGAGIDHWVTLHGPRRGRGAGALSSGGPPSPEVLARRRADLLESMSDDLSLSATQRAGIDSVMRHTDSLLHVVRLEMQPRLTQIFDSSRAEIAARLDSAQRVKFARQQPPRRDRR